MVLWEHLFCWRTPRSRAKGCSVHNLSIGCWLPGCREFALIVDSGNGNTKLQELMVEAAGLKSSQQMATESAGSGSAISDGQRLSY